MELWLSEGDQSTSFCAALNHKNYYQTVKFMKNNQGHLIYSQDGIRDVQLIILLNSYGANDECNKPALEVMKQGHCREANQQLILMRK